MRELAEKVAKAYRLTSEAYESVGDGDIELEDFTESAIFMLKQKAEMLCDLCLERRPNEQENGPDY